jgi:GlpG protein
MRQIATLADGDAARRVADYLLTLQIKTRLDEEPDGWAVWVCDEDRVAEARQELEEFLRNPADPRYADSKRGADTLRRLEAKVEARYRRRQERALRRWEGAGGGRTVTFLLVIVSLAVALASGLGRGWDQPVMQHLAIAPVREMKMRDDDGQVRDFIVWDRLDAIKRGQAWRLVTPIFLHFGFPHLLFNMIMLVDLGGIVEARRGSLRFLVLVVALAVASNLVQYYLGPIAIDDWRHFLQPSPLFGGMSGVLYGLFGYLWMKSKFDPDSGFFIHPANVVILMAWFFLCLSSHLTLALHIGRVANGAHAGGLVAGMVIGYAPCLWRRLRNRGG